MMYARASTDCHACSAQPTVYHLRARPNATAAALVHINMQSATAARALLPWKHDALANSLGETDFIVCAGSSSAGPACAPSARLLLRPLAKAGRDACQRACVGDTQRCRPRKIDGGDALAARAATPGSAAREAPADAAALVGIAVVRAVEDRTLVGVVLSARAATDNVDGVVARVLYEDRREEELSGEPLRSCLSPKMRGGVYVGVRSNRRSSAKPWKAVAVCSDGVEVDLGDFAHTIQAAHAYDDCMRALQQAEPGDARWLRVNFPAHGTAEVKAVAEQRAPKTPTGTMGHGAAGGGVAGTSAGREKKTTC
jgi:hypothetical protein